MSRTRISSLLVALAALTSSVTAGCGTATSDDATVSSGAEFAAIEKQANELYTRISGDAREREAAHYLKVQTLNEPFIECVESKGFNVASPFHPLYTGWEPNATAGAWLGELSRPLSPQALALAKSTRSELQGARGPDYDKAARTCEQDAVTGVADSQLREPEGWLDLVGEYRMVLDEVEAELGPISEYTNCMKAAGVDYYTLNGEDAMGYNGLYLALEGLMPQAPLSTEQPTKEWDEYLKFEADAMAADVACREDRYHQGLRLLAPKLDEFEETSHDAIEAMHQQWQSLVVEAERLRLPL